MTQDITIQLRIRPHGDTLASYDVEAWLLGDNEHYSGELQLDEQQLLINQLQTVDYGMSLFRALFADRIRAAYNSAQARLHAGDNGVLRLRLWIDDRAARLHAIPWERLYHDPEGSPLPLTIAERTPFSRYAALEAGDALPLRQDSIQMVVTIANPHELHGLPPIDVVEEVANLTRALGDLRLSKRLCVSIMSGRTTLPTPMVAELHGQNYQVENGAASLNHIMKQLEDADFWHHIGHGMFDPDESGARLLLEDENGNPRWVREGDLVSKLAALHPGPHLIFLSACDSAKRDGLHPLVGLAPRLVRNGVPAVVAMQDRVPVELAQTLTRDFYGHLFEHGEIDLAMNQSRRLLFDSQKVDWSIPVLYSRLAGNELIDLHADVGLQETDRLMMDTETVLEALRNTDVNDHIVADLDDVQQQWLDRYTVLLELCQSLRKVSENPAEFPFVFHEFYMRFQDFYLLQNWADEERLIRTVDCLRQEILPQIKEMSPARYEQVASALEQHVDIPMQMLRGFDHLLKDMDEKLQEVADRLNAGQVEDAILLKRGLWYDFAPNLKSSNELLKRMGRQITEIARLLAEARLNWRANRALDSARLLASTDAPAALHEITAALEQDQQLDQMEIQAVDKADAPEFVRTQVRELRDTQRNLSTQGKQIDPQTLYRLAMQTLYVSPEKRNYDLAVQYLRQAVAVKPDATDSYFSLSWLEQGLAHQALDRQDLAAAEEHITAAREAIQFVPEDVRGLNQRGFVAKTAAQIAEKQNDPMARQTHLREAAGYFEQVLQRRPDDPGGQVGVGNMYDSAGDLDAAIAAYRRAIALAPRYTAAHHDLARAYSLKMGAEHNPRLRAEWCEKSMLQWRRTIELASKDPLFSQEKIEKIEGYVEQLECQSPP